MVDPHLDSDDDAPEEVSLNKGRVEAEQSRKNEKENSKRLAAERKEKRKAQLEKKQESLLEIKKKKEEKKQKEEKNKEKNKGKKERRLERRKLAAITDTKPENENSVLEKPNAVPEKSSSRKRNREQTDASKSAAKSETASKVVGSVMLDDSVVQLIRAREKQVGKSDGVAKHKYIREIEPEPEQKKAKPSKQKYVSKNSRIQIVSLKRKPDTSALKEALKFRNSRLFGKSVHRSLTMLPTKPFVASV